jgi:hypothetical protein
LDVNHDESVVLPASSSSSPEGSASVILVGSGALFRGRGLSLLDGDADMYSREDDVGDDEY